MRLPRADLIPVLMVVAVALCVPSATSALQTRDAPGPAVTRSDSAGVTISENSGAEWTEATAWRLSREPTLTIGLFDGPEEYLLFRARGARRLRNGNIVIANEGTHELRFYDPNGTYVRGVGREGEGPGEFRWMTEPWSLGSDSIAVWDSQNGRLTVFDIGGELGRSFRLDPFPEAWIPRPTPQGILADNSLLVSATVGGRSPEGLSRRTIGYALYSLEGAHLTTLVRRPGSEINTVTQEHSRLSGGVPYGRRASVTAFGNRWYYGSSDGWEIEVYSSDGALTHLFRRDEPNRPVTQKMIDEYRDPILDLYPDMLERMARAGLSRPTTEIFPETLPAYRSFIAGDDGSLWVERYTLPSEQPSWAVFRDDGRYLGVVETPIGGQVTHIGGDFVLVIWEDELEVEHVQMYELIKP